MSGKKIDKNNLEARTTPEPGIAADQARQMDLAVGGQALIEGVMMRSPHYTAVAVRKADGQIVVHDEPFVSLVKKRPGLNKPLLRGVFALFESMVLGIRALNFSANIALEDAETETDSGTEDSSRGWFRWAVFGIVCVAAATVGRRRFPGLWSAASSWLFDPSHRLALVAAGVVILALIVLGLLSGRQAQTEPGIGIGAATISITIAFSLLLGIVLFVVVPNALAHALVGRITQHPILLNLGEGLFRIIIFVAYVGGISLLPDIRRVFAYHGADHKVVWTQEKGLPLTVESASPFPVAHPRCGTSFALFVLVLSILLFAFLGWPAWYWRILSRLVLLPVVAGIAYELLKLTAKQGDRGLAHLFILPGLWLQRLTTREPDAQQLEVAIRAMQTVLERENAHVDQASAVPAGG